MDGEFRYRAFISYAHADEASARWLHQRLERYRVPSRLVGRPGAHGKPVPRRIGRCFRDEAELSAASHLSETLQQALAESQALIVVCSPRAAASRWVNDEIRFFRSLGREADIYALIVAGEPNAADPAQECFPPALLRDDGGQPLEEPLAADARDHRDGKADGFLKLAAGLVGVGFDDLRRREQRRRGRLMAAAVGVSLGVAAVTTALAVTASRARDEATQRREEADDLISFMLGDLKGQLERVGRLDVLDSTVGKASGYLGAADPAAQTDTELAEQVAALSAVADIRYARGDLKSAMEMARHAIAQARALRARQPGQHSDALFAEAVHSYAEPALDSDDFVTPAPLLVEALALSAPLPLEGSEAERNLLLKVAVRDSQGFLLSNGPKPDLARSIADGQESLRMLQPFFHRQQASPAIVTATLRQESQLGVSLYHAARFDESVQQWRQFVEQGGEARRRYPRDQPLQYILQSGLANAVKVFSRRGDLDDAATASRDALEIGRGALAYEPDYAEGAVQLGQTYAADAELKVRRRAWDEVQHDVDDGLAVLRPWTGGTAPNLMARQHAMRLYQAEADLAMNQRHSSRDALAALAAGLALVGESERSSAILVSSVLPLQWRQWFVARDADAALAQAARAATLKLLEQLRPEVDTTRLDLVQAVADYLDGRVAHGDEVYAALRTRGDPLLTQLDPVRAAVCAAPRAHCPARPGP